MQLRKESLKKSGLPGFELVRALHRYRRGQGSNPGKPDFFRLSFRNCIKNETELLSHCRSHKLVLNVFNKSTAKSLYIKPSLNDYVNSVRTPLLPKQTCLLADELKYAAISLNNSNQGIETKPRTTAKKSNEDNISTSDWIQQAWSNRFLLFFLTEEPPYFVGSRLLAFYRLRNTAQFCIIFPYFSCFLPP